MDDDYKKKQKEYKKDWYKKNKERLSDKYLENKDYYKDWYEQNKEKLSDKYLDNKEEIIEKRRKYYEENKVKISEYNKKYREENSEHFLEYNQNYYQKNKDKFLESAKTYREENIEQYREYHKNYMSNRVNSDNLFKLSKNIRCLIKKSFTIKNKTKTTDLIGCSIEEFKLHLESKFEVWMTWDNYGKYNGELNYGWDIDHIIPLSSAKTEDILIKLNHFSNLQPLCSKVNRYIKRDLFEQSNCLFCGNELSYIKYCDDNCRKKYYISKIKNE